MPDQLFELFLIVGSGLLRPLTLPCAYFSYDDAKLISHQSKLTFVDARARDHCRLVFYGDNVLYDAVSQDASKNFNYHNFQLN